MTMTIEIREPVSGPADWTDRLAVFAGAAGAFGGFAPNCVPLGARATSWEEVILILEEAETVGAGVEPGCFPSPQPWRHREGVVSYGAGRSTAHLARDGRVWATAPRGARASARFRAQGAEAMARRWGHLGHCQAAVQDSARAVALLRAYEAAHRDTECRQSAQWAGYMADHRPWLSDRGLDDGRLDWTWEEVLTASGAADVPLVARWMRS